MQTYGGDMERNRESILYIETDIPPQMTCSEWRRSRTTASRRRLLVGRLRGRRGVAIAAARAS